MKYILRVFLMVLSVLVLTQCSTRSKKKDTEAKTENSKEDPYNLVWSDEFETDGVPDSTKWTYENGFVRNEELQWYQPQNAFCENGFLIIEGRKETLPNPNHDAASENWKEQRTEATYTSASVTTKGLHAWKYGRFEIKSKNQDTAWPMARHLDLGGQSALARRRRDRYHGILPSQHTGKCRLGRGRQNDLGRRQITNVAFQ